MPHRVYPPGYHCDPQQPLPFACLASQKNYLSLHLGCVYGGTPLAQWFQEAWTKTGKKLDMGRACIRFKKVEDLALDVIGEAIRRVPARKYVAFYESVIKNVQRKPSARSAKTKKPTASARRRA